MKINELVEGVEYEKVGSGKKYRVEGGKLQVLFDDGELKRKWIKSGRLYNEVIDIEFKECEFKPKQDERYYFPTFNKEEGYNYYDWDGENKLDRNVQRCVGVFRTKEQAIEKARELGWYTKRIILHGYEKEWLH